MAQVVRWDVKQDGFVQMDWRFVRRNRRIQSRSKKIISIYADCLASHLTSFSEIDLKVLYSEWKQEHEEQSSLFNLKEYFLWACSRLTVYSYLSLLQIFLRHVDKFYNQRALTIWLSDLQEKTFLVFKTVLCYLSLLPIMLF